MMKLGLTTNMFSKAFHNQSSLIIHATWVLFESYCVTPWGYDLAELTIGEGWKEVRRDGFDFYVFEFFPN